jgi:hypothetical protein
MQLSPRVYIGDKGELMICGPDWTGAKIAKEMRRAFQLEGGEVHLKCIHKDCKEHLLGENECLGMRDGVFLHSFPSQFPPLALDSLVDPSS